MHVIICLFGVHRIKMVVRYKVKLDLKFLVIKTDKIELSYSNNT